MSARRLPVRRDSLLFALGILGIGYQQYTGRFNLALMILYGLMVGVPGLAQLIVAFRGLSSEEVPTSSTGPSSEPLPRSESSTS